MYVLVVVNQPVGILSESNIVEKHIPGVVMVDLLVCNEVKMLLRNVDKVIDGLIERTIYS